MKAIAILVEDNSIIRKTLIPAMQELAGIDVVATAEDVDGALAALDRYEWNLVVLDLFLREGSGLDVLSATPSKVPGRHIFVLTNYATADVRRRCLDLGADEVFDKSTELEPFFDRCVQVSAASQRSPAGVRAPAGDTGLATAVAHRRSSPKA
ncbi:MAG: response regulator [Comamonadaceae bacterium]|nr:MAG: response regulator [Comamonadaceae bacterium]